ncbi:MAG: FkbM family methyltransferase, partial [Gemmatimonadota bacterium]
PVPCLTFDDLCERHGLTDVDLLHIDAEGTECEILRQVDFGRTHPAIVIYEHVQLTPGEKALARRILVRAGYDTIEKGDDTIAVHRAARASLRPLRSAWRRIA